MQTSKDRMVADLGQAFLGKMRQGASGASGVNLPEVELRAALAEAWEAGAHYAVSLTVQVDADLKAERRLNDRLVASLLDRIERK